MDHRYRRPSISLSRAPHGCPFPFICRGPRFRMPYSFPNEKGGRKAESFTLFLFGMAFFVDDACRTLRDRGVFLLSPLAFLCIKKTVDSFIDRARVIASIPSVPLFCGRGRRAGASKRIRDGRCGVIPARGRGAKPTAFRRKAARSRDGMGDEQRNADRADPIFSMDFRWSRDSFRPRNREIMERIRERTVGFSEKNRDCDNRFRQRFNAGLRVSENPSEYRAVSSRRERFF